MLADCPRRVLAITRSLMSCLHSMDMLQECLLWKRGVTNIYRLKTSHESLCQTPSEALFILSALLQKFRLVKQLALAEKNRMFYPILFTTDYRTKLKQQQNYPLARLFGLWDLRLIFNQESKISCCPTFLHPIESSTSWSRWQIYQIVYLQVFVLQFLLVDHRSFYSGLKWTTVK